MSRVTPLARALLAIAGTAALLGAACKPAVLGTTDEPRILQVSTAYKSSVSPEEFTDRHRELTRALRRLRQDTGSGWIGRQDDETGYLGELRGGTFAGDGDPETVAGAFLEAWAPSLFGVGATELAFLPGEGTAGGPVVLRAEQQVEEIPVLDGELTVTVATPEASPRVSSVRGRVFPGIDVSAQPTITGARARSLAEQASGGTARQPDLVVMPLGESGVLAWEVFVVGGSDAALPSARYYVSAGDGAILAVRPASVQFSPFSAVTGPTGAVAGQATDGESVELSGRTPAGTDVTANGTTQGGRFLLIDTTTATYDSTTAQGGIETHDATGLDQEGLPGPVASSATAEVADAEALGAHVYSRAIYDYYTDVHGRSSWDGEGGTLLSSVHFGGPEFCNAFFNGEQMVYGSPCESTGARISTFVDVDIAAHEVTHGVTATGSSLLYTGQSGALNESLSDYFGNVIGNAFTGEDSVAVGEGGCIDVPPDEDSVLCKPNPDGTRSIRYMLSDLAATDYAFLLDPPIAHKLLGLRQDNGGVHLNSQIFNNSLWEIRTRLAQLDQADGNSSPRAQAFDRAVYIANSQILTPTSGFLDARRAIEQAARETGMDATAIRAITQVFDQTGVDAENLSAPPSQAQSVIATSAAQKGPSAGDGMVAWIDYPGGEGLTGQASFAEFGGTPTVLGTGLTATSVAFAGDQLVVADDPGVITLYGPGGGTGQVLDPAASGGGIILGLAGSAQGAAWLNFDNATLGFVDAQGAVTTSPVPPGATSFPPLSIGTGGGTVAIGEEGGNIVVWPVGGQPELIQVPGGHPLAVDVYGDRLLVVSFPGDLPIRSTGADLSSIVTLVDLGTGTQTVLSRNAMPFGATVGPDYAVWSQAVQGLSGGVVGNIPSGEGAFQDTDLWMYSQQSGTIYSVLALRGQQGYPSLEGDRLVWQEAAAGGDDVSTGSLPAGL